MKKKLFTLLLALTMLMPACADTSANGSSSLGDNITSEQQGNSSLDGDSSSDKDGSGNTSEDNEQYEGHVDENKDGVCDDCKTSVVVNFDFIAVNDLHGKFADTESNEGVDELSTYVKQTRSENKNTIVLSSGDMWQGSSESNLTKGNIITEWMNELDFAAMTLGNHEYDWGEEYIKQNLELAEFPFLGINVYNSKTSQRAEYCQPSVTVEQNGVKIGIIGAIGDCLSSISGDKVGDVYFKTDSELTELVKAESNRLRADGADFIVYSIHDGHGSSYNADKTLMGNLGYYESVLSDGYVDLVFEGHSHQHYVIKDGKGIYHLQGGGDNDGVSHAEVNINYVTGDYTVVTADFVTTSEYDDLADDPIVETLMEKYSKQISAAGKVLGQNDKYRGGLEILSTCAQLYYQAGVEKWGDKYDIVLGGGYMSVRSPYCLQMGQVIYGDLQSILPFDNQLVLCSISGYYLKTKFFETNNENYYIAYGTYGEEVKSNIDNNATYYLVTDTYSSTYAPNHLTEIERYDESTFARDLLAKYIEQGGFSVPVEEITLTSIPKIHEMGNALQDNAETSDKYFVKGKIISIDNTTYGNFTIEDEAGNTLYVYGLYDRNGIRYDGMSNPPQVGDTVILHSVIKHYVNANTGERKVEFIYATLWSIE